MKKNPLLIIVVFVILLSGCNSQPLEARSHSSLWTSSASWLVTELWSDLNPASISYHPFEYLITAQQILQVASTNLTTAMTTDATAFTEAGNIALNTLPGKSGRLNQTSTQDQELFPVLLVFIIVLIILVLIVLALIYFRKTRFLQKNSQIGSPQSIRYDSKISLCSLVFDQLNAVLYIAHGKKQSQIKFTELSAFEVSVNTNCLLKIDRDDTQIFDIETEESLSAELHKLEQEKLPKDAIRQIALEIFSDPAADIKPVLVNFYYREGDLRLSSHSFSRSVDDVLLWCDLLESAIRPVVNEHPEPDSRPDTAKGFTESVNTLFQANSEQQTKADAIHNNHDIADELTRLADLKVKGFLSEEEFQKAKAKIIN